MKKYITSKFDQKIEIYSRPDEDFGYDYETDDSYETMGDKYWHHTESGLVKIDVMIEHLKELQNTGSNYVGCEWHCDHGEMELYGFSLKMSSQPEIDKYLEGIEINDRKKKEIEIQLLENNLKKLKKSLV